MNYATFLCAGAAMFVAVLFIGRIFWGLITRSGERDKEYIIVPMGWSMEDYRSAYNEFLDKTGQNSQEAFEQYMQDYIKED